jgi:hypothetical protein
VTADDEETKAELPLPLAHIAIDVSPNASINGAMPR